MLSVRRLQRSNSIAKNTQKKKHVAKTPSFSPAQYVRVRKPGHVIKGRQRFMSPQKILERRQDSYLLEDGKAWNQATLARVPNQQSPKQKSTMSSSIAAWDPAQHHHAFNGVRHLPALG